MVKKVVKKKGKGLGKKTAAAKRREKALVTNNKILKRATGKWVYYALKRVCNEFPWLARVFWIDESKVI